MQGVAAAFGDDVHDPADSPSELRAVTAVDDAKLLHCLLGRSGFLDARGGGHVVGAIDRNEVVMNVLARKGKLGDGFDNHIGAAGSGVADCDPWGQEREVDELAAV